MATKISQLKLESEAVQTSAGSPVVRFHAPLFLCLLLICTRLSAADPIPLTNFLAYYTGIYTSNLLVYAAKSNDAVLASQVAKACFDVGEFATNDAHRAHMAEEGISLSRQALKMNGNLPQGHYYLAINLGQLARTKFLGALKLVREMETALKFAANTDPKLEHAGPDRCLGLLYRDAPGWPASVGNKSKARIHLLKAVELAGDYPENQLNLIESFLEWNERGAAKAKFKEVETTLQQARMRLTGDTWAACWDDWNRRWQALTAKISLIR